MVVFAINGAIISAVLAYSVGLYGPDLVPSVVPRGAFIREEVYEAIYIAGSNFCWPGYRC
jgi:hypothetical protein